MKNSGGRHVVRPDIAGLMGAFGAALLAGSGVGIFSDPREAVRRCLRIDRELAPDPGTAETYRKLFASYKGIHDAMAPVYRAMRDGCRTRK